MISEKTAWTIRDLRSQGRRQGEIARTLQVSRSTVGRVIHGKWKPRRFPPRQVSRLLALWETAMDLMPGALVGQCRACGEPVHLPCVSCLARVLDLFGVRTPLKLREQDCVCGGNFTQLRPASAKPLSPRRADCG